MSYDDRALITTVCLLYGDT